MTDVQNGSKNGAIVPPMLAVKESTRTFRCSSTYKSSPSVRDEVTINLMIILAQE